MKGNFIRYRPQIKALVALVLSLIAIVCTPVVFGWGSGTYTAAGSIGVFYRVIIVTLVFYCLTFITRWFVIPGLISSLFGVLAIGTFILAVMHHGGLTVIIAPMIAFIGLIYVFFYGVVIFCKSRSINQSGVSSPSNSTFNSTDKGDENNG